MSGTRSHLSRRAVLRALLGGGTAAFAGAPLGLSLMSAAAPSRAASADDYRALVCVLLAGGADSFNMLVPSDPDGHAEYAAARSDLALPLGDLVELAGTHQGGRRFGMHPGLAPLAPLFESGELAWLANAGSLVEPTSPDALAAGTARLPLGLYSHSDQIAQWQTAVADVRTGRGVGGRIADLLGDVNGVVPVSMNLSVSGTNVFQSGAASREYAIDPRSGGAPVPAGYGEDAEGGEILTPAIDAMLAAPRSRILRAAYGERFAAALAAGEAFNDALAATPVPATPFPASPFGDALALIAHVIAARGALGPVRQTFFVNFGGWDHHDDVLDNQAAMLPVVGHGLAAFRDAMVELGVHGRVTTFTISDFGRTLSSNGKGSDHGWGGNALILGGAVNGGELHGNYPSLALGSALDTGRGRLLPTTSVAELYAEMALWFGVAPSDVPLVVPNIGRFADVSGGVLPVGFLRG